MRKNLLADIVNAGGTAFIYFRADLTDVKEYQQTFDAAIERVRWHRHCHQLKLGKVLKNLLQKLRPEYDSMVISTPKWPISLSRKQVRIK